MLKLAIISAALVVLATVAGCQYTQQAAPSAQPTAAPATPVAMSALPTVAQSSIGDVLVDGDGLTLYVFDNDPPNGSACAGDCAAKWPPLLASSADQASGDFSIFARDDGALQWAYGGRPLYGWTDAAGPGDVSGDGVGGVWWAARP